MLRRRSLQPAPAVQVARGQAGEFALHAKINGVKAPMVIDTGATSVVLTWETAKAIGLPLEFLEYDVDVETAGGVITRPIFPFPGGRRFHFREPSGNELAVYVNEPG